MKKYGRTDLIQQNIAPDGAKRICIFDTSGNKVGSVKLGRLAKPNMGGKLYTFGLLSDIHYPQTTSDTDLQNALSYLSTEVDFTCICGDLTHNGTNSELATYKSIVDTYVGSMPVYAITGNHESYPDGLAQGDIESRIEAYTGHPLYYSFERENDVFVMVGIRSNTAGELFTTAELQWLYETLEANRNRRCFVHTHVRPDDACGNAFGIYGTDIWDGRDKAVFESLIKHYTNCILFHGHSHLEFGLQTKGNLANIDTKFGRYSVHVSSMTVPRTGDEISATGRNWENLFGESEGYVVDVYENGIHLKGRDFAYNNGEGRWLPIASYWLDTTLQTIPAGTYSGPMP